MMNSAPKYLPVDPDFYDIIAALIGKSGTVHFFEKAATLNDVKGVVQGIEQWTNEDFLNVQGQLVRLDRIVAVLGKPGPAYDEYSHYANVCFACHDEGQFS